MQNIIIGIAGLARAGKGTAADILLACAAKAGASCRKLDFADPIREGVACAGITRQDDPAAYRAATRGLGEGVWEIDKGYWIRNLGLRIEADTDYDYTFVGDVRTWDEVDYVHKTLGGLMLFIDGISNVDIDDDVYAHRTEEMAMTFYRMLDLEDDVNARWECGAPPPFQTICNNGDVESFQQSLQVWFDHLHEVRNGDTIDIEPEELGKESDGR